MLRPLTLISFIFLLTLRLPVMSQVTFEKLKVVKDHPRLLLLKGEEKRIAPKINGDATYNFLHKIIIKECEAIMGMKPVEKIMTGKNMLPVARECRRRVFYLSYGFRSTGDVRYLKRAETEMMAAVNFDSWNPSHFLDAAELTMGIAIGYDWLRDALSEEVKTALADAIIYKGLRPSLLPENNSWLKANHNWNQVCNASLAFGAIAVLDTEPKLAREILERSIVSVRLPMQEYHPDGAYPEGYGYWGYGTSFNVMLISALERAFDYDFGLSTLSGFLKTPYFLLHMTGPTGKPFNYSDSDGKSFVNPAMVWFAARTKDPSLMTVERKLMEEQKTHLHRIRELPAAMVWGLDLDFSNVPTPTDLIWSGGGRTPVALIRSSWKGKDGLYAAIKGGSAVTAHGHMDAGSFVIDAMGERWATDLGMQDYNSLQSKGIKLFIMRQESDRWKVFRMSNHSHNTLTFNNSLHKAEGYAPLLSTTNLPYFRSGTVDLTDIFPDARKAHRGIAIAEDKYIIVRDEIDLKNASTVRWNMLTEANVNIIDNRTAVLMKNGKKLTLRINEPSDAVFTTWTTNPPQPYDAPNPGTVRIGFDVRRNPSKPFSIMVTMVPDEVTLENKMAIPPLTEWPLINQP